MLSKKSKIERRQKSLECDFWTTPPLRCSFVSIRRSMVVFLRSDVVPHVAAHKTHQQLYKISFVTPKDFFDSIGYFRKSGVVARTSAVTSGADIVWLHGQVRF